jgi:NAD kinase
MIEDLLMQQYNYFYRNRCLFEMDNIVTGTTVSKLCLNEVFAAEKDVSCTSMYKLVVDGKSMGKFKSSGILISTGTGSTGWLYSAR